jgi:squalene monooxygenase
MAEAAGVGQLGGAAVATLLAALFLAIVFRRQRRRRGAPVEGSPAPVDVPDREGSAAVDGPTDVIIVGAGVAGSALAYTLGKVASLLPFSFLPVLPFRSAG